MQVEFVAITLKNYNNDDILVSTHRQEWSSAEFALYPVQLSTHANLQSITKILRTNISLHAVNLHPLITVLVYTVDDKLVFMSIYCINIKLNTFIRETRISVREQKVVARMYNFVHNGLEIYDMQVLMQYQCSSHYLALHSGTV